MDNSGRLVACVGSSRSGKSQFVRWKLRGMKRVLIWDIKGEYGAGLPGLIRVTNRAALVQKVKEYAGRAGVIAYTGQIGDFEFFCKAAQVWVRSHYLKKARSVLVFEETADVTSPAKAPPQYGIILRRYLAYGVTIYAVTQRPAESDKTAIGNASELHVCRMNLADDRRSVARSTGIPGPELEQLIADQDKGYFEFIHADTGRRKFRRGALTFAAGNPVFGWKTPEKPL